MATLRQWHSYIGAFIAPSVLFFALTGIIQIFSLHEARGNYHPYAFIEKLGKLHKDQEFVADHHDRPHHDGPGSATAPQPATSAASAAPSESRGPVNQPPVKVYLLKWVFTFVALGLFISTILGVWMGLAMSRRRKPMLWLLAAGVIMPVCLIVF